MRCWLTSGHHVLRSFGEEHPCPLDRRIDNATDYRNFMRFSAGNSFKQRYHASRDGFVIF
jgi:hypothetical protein